MDWTRIKKDYFLTLTSKCDLDLGAIDLGLARNTLSHDGQHLLSHDSQHFCPVISKSIKEWQSYGPDTKKGPYF